MLKNREKKPFQKDMSVYNNNTDYNLLNNSKNNSVLESSLISRLNEEKNNEVHDEIKLKSENTDKEEKNVTFENDEKNINDSGPPLKRRLSYLLPTFFSSDNKNDTFELNLKVKEKKKNNEIVLREKSNESKKVIIYKKEILFNPDKIKDLIDSERKTSKYGYYIKYIRFLDLITATLTFLNIVLALIDNNIYIIESNNYLQNIMIDKGIKSKKDN